MTFERWGYEFNGAYTSPDSLHSDSGAYVIWCKDRDNWIVVDVVESDDPKQVMKAAMIIRSCGHSTTEILSATPWDEFLEMI